MADAYRPQNRDADWRALGLSLGLHSHVEIAGFRRPCFADEAISKRDARCARRRGRKQERSSNELRVPGQAYLIVGHG